MDNLDKTVKINMLLGFYSNLLTDKQLEYIELYFEMDLSLSEIASQYNISRNAVHDNIQRSIKQLETYEEKLQLLEKYSQRKALYDKIRNDYQDEQLHHYLDDLENLE